MSLSAGVVPPCLRTAGSPQPLELSALASSSRPPESDDAGSAKQTQFDDVSEHFQLLGSTLRPARRSPVPGAGAGADRGARGPTQGAGGHGFRRGEPAA